MSKSGTPTMGGAAFAIAAAITASIACTVAFFMISRETALSIALAMIYALLNSAIGFIDDLKKLKHQKNAGLTPKQKLILQIAISVIYLFSQNKLLGCDSKISFSFMEVELGILYYPITLFILIGIVNSVNLTDGIDGLASSVAFASGTALFYICANSTYDGSVLSSILIGAVIAFLIFNIHPARIFMGDTGSLFLGALIASFIFCVDNPFLIIFVAGIYVIEGISVVLQVLFYKATHKRLFKMAPLHHHLERCGWSENKICTVAILLSLLFAIPAFIFAAP